MNEVKHAVAIDNQSPGGGDTTTHTGLGKTAGRRPLRPVVRAYEDPSDGRLYVTYHKNEIGERRPTGAEVTAAVARFLESERRASRPASSN